MKQAIDPIAYAWKLLNRNPLPPVLQINDCQRAGYANAAKGKTGKGKHVLAVCV